MKHIAAILSVVFLFAMGAIVQAQSLADIAEKEKQRREEIKQVPEEITNTDVKEFTGGSISTDSSSSEPAQSASKNEGEAGEGDKSAENDKGEDEKASDQTKKADSDEPVDLQGRTESYWKETMAAAEKKVKDLEDEANVLTLKQNGLEDQFYNDDDGFDRDKVQREIQKTYYLQDANKENLEKAKKELEDLREDGRKNGALPGWLE
jgi:hypothetical protein